MTSNKLTRRTAFRLAVLFSALFSAAIIIIFTVLYISITRDLNAHLKDHVSEVIATLVEVDRTIEPGALAKAVNDRGVVAQQEEDIYLLTDKSGGFLAGNIHPLGRLPGWQNVPWDKLAMMEPWSGTPSSTAAIGRWTEVKDGYLFVADGNGDVIDAQRILLKGLGVGVAMAAALGLLGGLLPGISAQRRVNAIRSTLDAVSHGELASRIPLSASDDDLDHVANLINGTLDRLQRLIESLKQVSTDIAHDLKTPISRVRQKLEMTQNLDLDSNAYRRNVDEALADIDDIVETFEALLRIAEIEAGRRRARFADVDLKDVLSTVADALGAVAEDAGHRLETNLASTGPVTVRGDRQLLTQLCVNLIENSIRHCNAGALIKLELIGGPNPCIVASDTGPGIPPTEYANVLRPLYRLEKSRTTPGSGLGLSLVSAIAELHEAKLSLSDNHPGLKIEIQFVG